MEITIEGKRYQLVPITEETEVSSEDLNYQKALMKARIYRSKYSDYASISEGELVARILEIDELSDEDYIVNRFKTWIDWERCYNAISCCRYNPYKSVDNLRDAVLGYVRDVYKKQVSIGTGFFHVLYSPEEIIDGEHSPANIKVMCVIESMDESLGSIDRDYLLPTDEQYD